MAHEVSPEREQSLRRGRGQSKVVRDYLEALQADGGRRRRGDRGALQDKVARLQRQIDEESSGHGG